MSAHPEYSPAERDQLAQELLELHFGCHEDPQALQTRLAAEPALRALQQEVLQQAKVLEAAVKPTIDPLALPTTPTTTAATASTTQATQKRGERAPSRWRWLRSPLGRLGAAASLAAASLLVCYVAELATEHAHASYGRDHLHLTVTAPRAVPGGAAWSFTAETRNLNGDVVDGEIRWRAFNANGLLLAQSSTGTQRGAATVTIPASQGLQAPARLTVTAATATDEVTHVLPLSAAAAGPLVHLTTDRAVYRPGEVVRARAVVLDRITRLPLPKTPLLQARLLDGRGSPIAFDQTSETADGVGSFVLALPSGSAGGPHTLELTASDGSLPTERVDFVVRTFQAPQLQKTVVLDRTSYAPGARGTAAVTALRLAAGRQGASGASAVATLVVDGTEVWREKRVLGALGEATFAFQVPKDVAKGQARFVATIDDGGIVETEVKPFVVPTGRVVVGMFPEGGELVAGVDNRVYVECTDPLGRAIDSVGDLLDERDRVVAKFRTAHQGRGTIAFVPKHGVAYRLRLAGQAEPFALPIVQERGVAMQLRGDELAAGAPLRLGLGGRGDGPWLLGVFCRGVLVGQTTLRADDDGELRADVTLPLLGDASGVLRATLFDRQLQPVAERLFLRASAQRLDIAITPAAAELNPGDTQKLTVRTTDETGRERLAVVGIAVTDDAVNALASEPRIGLVDYARLFADVDPKLERLEAFGDFFLGADGSASHADLLLGTRGWRRFVWRNDAAAQAAIAARGPNADAVLTREGFAQTPQVESNLQGATAKASSLAAAVENADERTRAFAWYALLVLLGLVWLEVVVLLLPRNPRRALIHATGWAALVCAVAILWPQTLGSSLPPGRAPSLAEDVPNFITDSGPAIPKRRDTPGRAASDFDQEAIQRGVLSNTSTLLRANGAPLPFDLGAGGWDDTIRFRGNLLFDGFDRLTSGLTFSGANPLAGAFFNDGDEGEIRARTEDFYRYIPHRNRQYAHQHTASDDRRDFAPTIYWNTLVVTRDRGTATVEFATSDAATTWRVHADAHTVADAGRLGQASTTFATRLPVQIEAKLPDEVAAGDRLLLPVNIVVRDPAATSVPLTVRLGDGLRLGAEAPTQVALQEGRGRALLPIDVLDRPGMATVQLEVRHGTFQDRVERTLVIAPRGFPHRRDHGGTLAVGTAANATITIPDASVPGSGRATLRLFPTPLTTLAAGLDGMLQEPHGCFEQTSSTNYPNTLVLQLLQGSGDAVPAAALRARELLAKGYARLVGFECKRGGFEWFGGDPGHEALTAYGLLQFHDMAQVFDVDAAMVARTRSWLLGRRNERGDFVHEGTDHHRFGNSQLLTNAYCTYALLQSGTKADELARELAALAARGKTSDDAYELALIANALGLAGHADAAALRQRLVALQRADGSLCGTTTSITCSGQRDLAVETTSYAVLAWLQDPAFAASSWRALQFVQTQRQGSGTFGATQATVCALRAMIAWANQHRQAATAGTMRVFAGERLLAERAFAADAMEPVRVELWSQLPAGEHTLRLEVATADSKDAAAVPATMPWALEVAYHAEQPADDAQAPLRLRTQLRRADAVEGDTVAVDVTVQNPSAQAVPTPIVRLGLPAGCELPTRVLEDLQKAGTFDHWELRGRDLVLYWRTLPAQGERTFVLDLVARVPGTTSGAASRVLPYYTPTAVHWAAPLQLAIAPR